MSTNCKFYKEEEYVSYDSGETWTAMGVYRKGDLIEYDSEDCGYVPPTPTGTKFSASYNNGTSYSAACNGNTTLTSGETRPNGYSYNLMGNAVIGDCVTTIGQAAFDYFTNLSSVTIPNSVTSIEMNAFYSATSLTNIELPSGLTSIGFQAFDSCESLSGITIPDSVTSIGNSAFFDCYALSNVTIGNSVTSIGNYAFTRCTSLTSVTIPNSVTSISRGVFNECTSLSSVTIPNSVTSIGESAFHNCSGLTRVNSSINGVYNIPTGVTSIDEWAFGNCRPLTSVTIPDSVTSIGGAVFANCAYLENVRLPNSLTSIENNLFQSCWNLPSVTIPNTVTSIGRGAFLYCERLTGLTIPSGVTSIGRAAFNGCYRLTAITIPNGVTTIEEITFKNCTSLTSITIPSGVTSIGSGACSGCTSLTSITINAITPPTLADTNAFDNTNNCSIYVPCESVDAYKSAENWSTYASRITCTTLPYDAEIEYLESTGTQYINTGIYLNTSNFEIGCSVADTYCLWGYCHQNVANGTWLSIECTSSQKTAFFGRFGSNYMVNMTSYIQSSGNTFVYKQNGITVNGTTISKSLIIGSDSIANVPLIFFGRYDFYKRGVEWIDYNKFKSFYVKNNNELVVDMIPVRVGQVGYMYDRVSGQLFGNSGSGSFVLGADKT